MYYYNVNWTKQMSGLRIRCLEQFNTHGFGKEANLFDLAMAKAQELEKAGMERVEVIEILPGTRCETKVYPK